MAIDPNNLQGTAHITFNEDFNSLSLWNGSNGVWSTTFGYQSIKSSGASLPSNGEQEWYINSNYAATASVKPWKAADGVLTITAAPASAEVSKLINGYGYTSGEINTSHSFTQTYGYFEMRAQLPKGQGFWPAFWLVPVSGAWPPELDVMEVLGNNTTALYNTVHTAQTGAHTSAGSGAVKVADMSTGYHTFGVDWEADYTTFYFDGQMTYRTATPSDMNQPMYMIANLAAGGYWPGKVVAGSTAEMKIDYIRAYASGGTKVTAPAAGDVLSPPASAPETTVPTTPSVPTTPATPAPTTAQVSTGAATYTAAAGVTGITLTGSHQTVTGNDADNLITSNNGGNKLFGGAGADTFVLGRGGDTATGGAGSDTFVFKETPWAAGHITDFGAGDKLDLTGLLAKAGYTGSDPVGAGVLKITADSAGSAQVWSKVAGTWWQVTTLDGVAPAKLALAGGVATLASTSTSTAPAPVGGAVSTGAATYTAPADVAKITLTGSHQTVTGNDADNLITSNNSGNKLFGGAGADTFILGRGGDAATGGAGSDTFVFKETPWAAGHVTDFGAGDKLDLTGLLSHAGYTGSDPVGAGVLKIVADAAGSAQVWAQAGGTLWQVTTLDGVAPAKLAVDGGVLGLAAATAPAPAPASATASVSTGAAAYTAAADVAKITLTGSHQTVTGNDADNLITSNNGGNKLFGGAGADTFILGRGGDTATGGAGSDTFVFKETPWAAGHVTDFGAGDTLDLTSLLSHAGCSASDPVAAGFLKIAADGHGSTQVWSHLDSGWWQITTLDGVSPGNLHLDGAFITG